jgi:Dual-action HEIGH metallo-peptidase
MRHALASFAVILCAACSGLDREPDEEGQVATASAELLAVSNRVSTSVHTICINGAAFTGVFSTPLNNAIANYNALALSFRFTRTAGSTVGCNAVINAMILAGFGTGSGFPSGGLPFGSIGLGSDFGVHNGDVLEHMITHLLGHNLGFVHTDTGPVVPVSCGPDQTIIPNFGGGGHSGGGGLGVIIPPGTPPPTAGGSIMNTCIPVSTNGELTSGDIAGLNSFY